MKASGKESERERGKEGIKGGNDVDGRSLECPAKPSEESFFFCFS